MILIEQLVMFRKNSPLTASSGAGRNSPLPKKGTSILKKPILKDRAVQSDFADSSGMNVPENGLDQTPDVHSHSPAAGSVSDPVRHEPQVWRWVHIFLRKRIISVFVSANPCPFPHLTQNTSSHIFC